MNYTAQSSRYQDMLYRRCGNSGILLPALSLGLWHNFGGVDRLEHFQKTLFRAFDLGVTHFDLANNYGPPPGSAEENFGHIMQKHLRGYRDEMILSTKAGYTMWPGPYGDWGSKKYLISSLDQSLKRMKVDYVDIFYSHRPDPKTPIEETMGALDQIVRQGKALYVGISNYSPQQSDIAIQTLRQMGTPCLIHQMKYSMLVRQAETGLMDLLGHEQIGAIAFSPLAQGVLTDRYLNGIPSDSRAGLPHGFLQESAITPELIQLVNKLHLIAQERGQSLAQMAIAWLLKDERLTSVLIGASSVSQLENNVAALQNITFSEGELEAIEALLPHP